MSALDYLRRRNLEQTIEDILFAYPYLISPELKIPRRQEVLSKKSRSDLIFYFEKRVIIVEIKRGLAGMPALNQLQRYLKEQSKHGFQTRGILVAHTFTKNCLAESQKYPSTISCKRLVQEVPIQVVICKNCRQARDRRMETCPEDGCSETLRTF